MEKKKNGWTRMMLKAALSCGAVGIAFLVISLILGVAY